MKLAIFFAYLKKKQYFCVLFDVKKTNKLII